MTEPLKVMVGPSGHYHQLKSGEMKYQKSKPAKPIWRVLVLDESKNKMHSRAFSSQPPADEIERVVLGVLQDPNLPSTPGQAIFGILSSLWFPLPSQVGTVALLGDGDHQRDLLEWKPRVGNSLGDMEQQVPGDRRFDGKF